MIIDKENINVKQVIREYLEYCYNECPDSFIVVKNDIEMTATDWCQKFGGTPKGMSNFEFLDMKFNEESEFLGDSIHDGSYGDD